MTPIVNLMKEACQIGELIPTMTAPNCPDLSDRFIRDLLGHCYKEQTDNFDWLRFTPARPAPRRKVKRWLKRLLIGGGRAKPLIHVDEGSQLQMHSRLGEVLAQFHELEAVYNVLADEPSRAWLSILLAYRVLSGERVKLPSNNAQYWQAVARATTELVKNRNTLPIQSLNGSLNYYELASIDMPVRLHVHPINILCTFLLEQYRYQRGGLDIGVQAGDVVIDGGGCWGDTALYLGHRAGPEGKVFSFEFAGENLSILNCNLDLNPALRQRIEVVPRALWRGSGEEIGYRPNGPGTSLVPGEACCAFAETKTIDDFVREEGLKRVDFIKLDIEGAELPALQGAEWTLRTYRPRLAVAVYHRPEDLTAIPRFLESLALGYQFYLDHFTIHLEETVLFGLPS